jgi:hypothetical protein
LVGRPEGKRPLGRLRRRGDDNFKTELQDAGQGSMDSLYLTLDRDMFLAVVKVARNFGLPKIRGNS